VKKRRIGCITRENQRKAEWSLPSVDWSGIEVCTSRPQPWQAKGS
jgi:hypothetical protein